MAEAIAGQPIFVIRGVDGELRASYSDLPGSGADLAILPDFEIY